MMTREQIVKYFGPLTDDQADRIEAVQDAGKRHGQAGYYPDGDFSSDADWCYGVGAEIDRLETELDVDDGSIGYLYQEAHGEHFQDGTINPGERDSKHTYDFQFGAYGDTACSVHANSLESALELAADWLADNAPGHLISEEEMQEALQEACQERGFAPDDIDWSDLRGEHAKAIEAAECDLTHTEAGWLRSWEWSVSER